MRTRAIDATNCHYPSIHFMRLFMWPAAWGKLLDASGVPPAQRDQVSGRVACQRVRRLPLVTWHIRVMVTDTGWDIIRASPSTCSRAGGVTPILHPFLAMAPTCTCTGPSPLTGLLQWLCAKVNLREAKSKHVRTGQSRASGCQRTAAAALVLLSAPRRDAKSGCENGCGHQT